MTVGQLKKKLEQLNDDLEILVSPVIERRMIGKLKTTLAASPNEEYPIVTVGISRKVEGEAFGPSRLILGYDSKPQVWDDHIG